MIKCVNCKYFDKENCFCTVLDETVNVKRELKTCGCYERKKKLLS